MIPSSEEDTPAPAMGFALEVTGGQTLLQADEQLEWSLVSFSKR